ncbi:unnamed protein product [Prorocentrum cordatum]|uniref:PDZ domain-containing protein n=1 Tax=Prorocentrum cordatum TaxID=2364126 RepID=A0ABN9UAQ9_9DINO|nr:unnamed protein product [Polarella glacialis]|mmetsp:Transcript_3900/g.10467  ORF Transcript_3900/g.10467 Transcript_3900/m.10467 type:complete len:141 (-) Transcript_3900:278-700(-)
MGNSLDGCEACVDQVFEDAESCDEDGRECLKLGFRMVVFEHSDNFGARELTFRREDSSTKFCRFSQKPLGLTFNKDKVPITITAVAPWSIAERRGVKVGMVLEVIGETDVADMDYDECFRLLVEGMKPLPGPPHESEQAS